MDPTPAMSDDLDSGHHTLDTVLLTELGRARKRLTGSLQELVKREVKRELEQVHRRLLVECGVCLELALQNNESMELEELRNEVEELRNESRCKVKEPDTAVCRFQRYRRSSEPWLSKCHDEFAALPGAGDDSSPWKQEHSQPCRPCQVDDLGRGHLHASSSLGGEEPLPSATSTSAGGSMPPEDAAAAGEMMAAEEMMAACRKELQDLQRLSVRLFATSHEEGLKLSSPLEELAAKALELASVHGVPDAMEVFGKANDMLEQVVDLMQQCQRCPDDASSRSAGAALVDPTPPRHNSFRELVAGAMRHFRRH